MQNNLNLIGRYKTSVLFFSYIISSINIQWDNIHITRQRQQGTSTSEKFRLRGASGTQRGLHPWQTQETYTTRKYLFCVAANLKYTPVTIHSGATPFHMHHRDYWSWSSLWIVHISCECALQRTVHITCHPVVFVESREPRDAAKVLQYMIKVSRREHHK